jgi:hypothetical protein
VTHGGSISLSSDVGSTITSGLIAVSTAKSVKSGDVTHGGSISLSSDVGSTTMSGSPYKACRRKEGCFRIFERQLRCMSMYAI